MLIFSAEPTSAYAPLLVQFDASQSYDPEGQQITIFWRFGDGTTFNAGGHPDDGTILASSNYRMTLDALGDGAGAVALGSSSWRMEADLAPGYRPPGEVLNLRFDDATTLRWDAEPTAVLYHVYDGDTCVPPALNQPGWNRQIMSLTHGFLPDARGRNRERWAAG